MNPIIRRELLDALRSRQALAIQLGLALACATLVLVRWPTGDTIDLTGARSMQVMRVFGYGLLAGVLLLVPAFPATSLVREKIKGTLALLLNSPMTPLSIYLGKLLGVLGFAAVLFVMTLPAAAACHALGGTGGQGGIPALYGLLAVAALQMSTLALYVSSRCQTTDGALRTTYALVLAMSVFLLVPHMVLGGRPDVFGEIASWLRCLSPIPAVVEVLNQGAFGTGGMVFESPVLRYLILATLLSVGLMVATVLRIDHRLLDRARAAGVMTQDRNLGTRLFRRFLYLVDPQRRSGSQSLWVNPVLVKEFRSRRFGRGHWTLRLIAVCAILSLGVSCLAALSGQADGIETTAGGLVLLQIALLVLFAPSLAAGLIASERETGSWQLLRMTPLSAGKILRGKLLSVAWPLLLLLCATLPGYIVMMTIEPPLISRMWRVLTCLVLTAVFAVLLSAAISSLFRSAATATTAAYLTLLTICVGPLLVWLGREAPFGHSTVERALMLDPVAAALRAAEMPGFKEYDLLPTTWWVIGTACVGLIVFLGARVWVLTRPE